MSVKELYCLAFDRQKRGNVGMTLKQYFELKTLFSNLSLSHLCNCRLLVPNPSFTLMETKREKRLEKNW